MDETKAYSQKQIKRAVNMAALMGWVVVVYPAFISANPMLIVWTAGIGLPIAFLVCWVLVAPILRRIMCHPISWYRAARWGIAISGIIAAISILIGRYLGWRRSVNPYSHSQVGGGDYVRPIDGILTPYGWQHLAQSTAVFILAGVAIALILRAIIGAGKTANQGEIRDENLPRKHTPK